MYWEVVIGAVLGNLVASTRVMRLWEGAITESRGRRRADNRKFLSNSARLMRCMKLILGWIYIFSVLDVPGDLGYREWENRELRGNKSSLGKYTQECPAMSIVLHGIITIYLCACLL